MLIKKKSFDRKFGRKHETWYTTTLMFSDPKN